MLCLRSSGWCGCDAELLGGLDEVEVKGLQKSKETAVALKD